MTKQNGNASYDSHFLKVQRNRLVALHDELIQVADLAGGEEKEIQLAAGGEAHDEADSAEDMAIQENNEAQYYRVVRRLAQIRRAIEKIDNGTYGFSDKSGDPIPRSRLLQIPEATLSLSEEKEEEARSLSL
jgi:DnaK suppressor protein